MIRKRTITNFINRVTEVITSGLSRNSYASLHNFHPSYFSLTFSKIYNEYVKNNLDVETFNKVVDLMTSIDSKKYGRYRAAINSEDTITEATSDKIIPSDEDPGDDINTINYERDSEGKIQYYRFKIYRRGKEPLTGKLTRDEANTIHRLYSYYGMSITQREVSRYFPEWSLVDFKRILRVFNITKASAPFAPHVIEENTSDKLLEMQLREKENDFLRKLEAERVKNNEKLLVKYAKENEQLRNQLSDAKSIVADLKFDPNDKISFVPKADSQTNTLFVWLSDMHIGASVSEQSIYNNNYDKIEVEIRLSKILDTVSSFKNLKSIIVCNLGDSLDGLDKQTSRRDHYLPQNMSNKEQVNTFISCMSRFMNALCEFSPNVKYYCVGESNHDGDFGYVANLALREYLNSQGIEATVFDSFIGSFKENGVTFVLCHGKDNKDMFKNLPLTLDVKTENFINEYLDYNNITGEVIFVKGDLHQSATTYGKRFKYKSVSSLFGSSEWIHKNFGNTLAACDYTIIDKKGNMFDSRILLQ